MKVILKLFLLLCALPLVMCSSKDPAPINPEKPEEPEVILPDKVIPKFIHSTYIVGNRLTANQISNSNFGKFSFMYLMAYPNFVATDFDLPTNDLFSKYVTNFNSTNLEIQFTTKAQSQNCKVLLSVAGTTEYAKIFQNTTRRARFAYIVAKLVEKYKYDGIEVDWEGEEVTISTHTALMNDIRTELNKSEKNLKKRLYLTTALAEWRGYNEAQSKALSDAVDWINIMTYDMGGGTWGDTPSHNTPLNIIEQRLSSNFRHFDKKKIVIGLGNYGYAYKGLSPGVKYTRETIAAQSQSPGWNTIEEWILTKGWTEQWDDVAKCPYFFSPDKSDFATCDNLRSLDHKIEWIVKEGFRGEFWWVFNCDYHDPLAGETFGTNTQIDHVEKRWKELIK